MFPPSTTRCLRIRHDVRDPGGGSGNCGRECCPVILPKWWLPRHLGIFYMHTFSKFFFVSMFILSVRSFLFRSTEVVTFLKSLSNAFFMSLYGLSTAFYLPAYSVLTPWSRVFLVKLTGSQLVKKFPTFYGTRRLITAFKKSLQLSHFTPNFKFVHSVHF